MWSGKNEIFTWCNECWLNFNTGAFCFVSRRDHWLATLWFTQVCCSWPPWLISQFFACNENHRHKIITDFYSALHITRWSRHCRLGTITCWSSCSDCAESRVSVLPIISRSARLEQSRSAHRARPYQRKPRWGAPGALPAPDSFQESQIWNYFSIVCLWSFVSALTVDSQKRGIATDVSSNHPDPGIIGGHPVFYFPLVTRSRWHRNKSMPCVGTRQILSDQVSSKYFLQISIKIDYRYYKA